MRSQPVLALNILKAFHDGPFTVRQTEGRFNGALIYMALQQTYKRDVKTNSFTGISQQPAAMEKYVRALPVLTAESEQTQAMTHLDLDDTKHHEGPNRHDAKKAESVNKITDVINNQVTHPLKCEEHELVKISTDRPQS